MVEQVLGSGCVQETFEEEFILEILVRYILCGDLDIQDVVHQLMDSSPCITIFLMGVSISNDSRGSSAQNSRAERAMLTITTNL